MITYAMDTNIISYILKNDEAVISRYQQEAAKGNEFLMLPIVYYEVSRWLLESKAKKLNVEFNNMCAEIPLIHMGKDVWDKAASIYVNTRKIGKPIGSDVDVIIAACCILNDCTLITNNIRHFENIDGLKLDNWKQ